MRERLSYAKGHDGYLFEISTKERGARPHPRPHMHEELELNLVVSGSASYALQRGRYKLGRGSLVWLFPDQPHLLVDWSESFRTWVLVFNRDCVARRCLGDAEVLAEWNPKGSFCRTLPEGDLRELQELYAKLKSLEGEPSSNSFNAGLDFALAMSWRAYGKAKDIKAEAELHPSVEKALALLGGERESMKIEELAKACGLSASRLSRLFNRQLGVSIPQFRNQLRMQAFHRLMDGTRPPTATEAALKAGFGSYVQFHRVFRSLSGVKVKSKS